MLCHNSAWFEELGKNAPDLPASVYMLLLPVLALHCSRFCEGIIGGGALTIVALYECLQASCCPILTIVQRACTPCMASCTGEACAFGHRVHAPLPHAPWQPKARVFCGLSLFGQSSFRVKHQVVWSRLGLGLRLRYTRMRVSHVPRAWPMCVTNALLPTLRNTMYHAGARVGRRP